MKKVIGGAVLLVLGIGSFITMQDEGVFMGALLCIVGLILLIPAFKKVLKKK